MEMEWKPGAPPEKFIDRPIIIAAKVKDKESKTYWYNVVFYYEPMGVWYGGPGIRVRDEDIEYWSDIPPPG